ncbi:small ribosomal subunit Rsm22 family protein, partial [Streptomyces sp. NPDC127091]|uniref:small ribosomal subunit Rsm22 family protein n=1 Tax=Streptomyces sp. NPDC127091 TaxID=3347134 RepID=UPI0036579F72
RRGGLPGWPAGHPPRRPAQAVERLIATYRGATPTGAPILRDRADVAAYAAYRMPATFEAVRSALAAVADAVPGWTPGDHVDVGGGRRAPPGAVCAPGARVRRGSRRAQAVTAHARAPETP